MKPSRFVATVLFTDIVGSTERAAELGDARGDDLLRAHHVLARREIARFHGHEVNTTGDGFLATFDAPERALRCACSVRAHLQPVGLEVRAGLHTGEIEIAEDDVGGIAVHVAARVVAAAAPGGLGARGRVLGAHPREGTPARPRGRGRRALAARHRRALPGPPRPRGEPRPAVGGGRDGSAGDRGAAVRLRRRGDPQRALSLLQEAQREATGGGYRAMHVNRTLRWWIGELLLEAGPPTEAARYFESFWNQTVAQDRLARIYEELGEYGKAREAYEFVALAWKDADPELQPRVAEAQQALKRLTSVVRE